MLELSELHCGYQKPLLGVNQRVKTDQVIFLIGNNGSGKSTLLKTIAGILKPLTGCVRYNQIPLNESTPFVLRPSYLPPVLQNDKELTGWDLMEIYQESRQSVWKSECIFEHLKSQHLLGKPLSKLSSGELKRVFLSAALTHPSQLVLLDEPLNYLDWEHQKGLTGLIQKHHHLGRGFVISTNDLWWPMQFPTSQTWKIQEGRLVVGTTRNMLSTFWIEANTQIAKNSQAIRLV